MSEANKIVLQKANAAMSAGDPEGFLAYCADNIKWTMVGEGTLQGKEAVRKWISTTYAKPPKFDVTRLIAEGDFLTALGGIAITDHVGKTTNYAYCDIWRFERGLLSELQGFAIEVQST